MSTISEVSQATLQNSGDVYRALQLLRQTEMSYHDKVLAAKMLRPFVNDIMYDTFMRWFATHSKKEKPVVEMYLNSNEQFTNLVQYLFDLDYSEATDYEGVENAHQVAADHYYELSTFKVANNKHQLVWLCAFATAAVHLGLQVKLQMVTKESASHHFQFILDGQGFRDYSSDYDTQELRDKFPERFVSIRQVTEPGSF